MTETTNRWWRWLRNHRLTCAADHHIPLTLDLGQSSDGFIRCNHWLREGRDQGHECGKWIWLVSIRGGGFIVVEVISEEKERMQKLSTPSEKIDFLGIFEEAEVS